MASCFFFGGIGLYLTGVVLTLPRYIAGNPAWLTAFNEAIVWYSGVPVMLGLVFASIDLFVLLGGKRSTRAAVRIDPIDHHRITVVLTAYDDELSIADAVADFRQHTLVEHVIVVSNNSRDRTMEFALAAGAVQ